MVSKVFGVLFSLPVAATLIGVLTLAIVYFGRLWSWGIYTLFYLAVPIVLAVAYLAWYSTLPYEPWTRRAPPPPTPAPAAPVADEPFEDPVEEADRLAQEHGAEAAETPVVVADDDAPPPSP